MTWQPPEEEHLGWTANDLSPVFGYTFDRLLAVRQQTIEECAKVCEKASMDLRTNDLQRIGAAKCAAAIRKLGAET
jgi:hypothetical protein